MILSTVLNLYLIIALKTRSCKHLYQKHRINSKTVQLFFLTGIGFSLNSGRSSQMLLRSENFAHTFAEEKCPNFAPRHLSASAWSKGHNSNKRHWNGGEIHNQSIIWASTTPNFTLSLKFEASTRENKGCGDVSEKSSTFCTKIPRIVMTAAWK